MPEWQPRRPAKRTWGPLWQRLNLEICGKVAFRGRCWLTAPQHVTKLTGKRADIQPVRQLMARKSDSDHPNSAKAQAAIKSLRTNIDKLDLHILKLVNERAALAA